ncbi:MAG: 60S ribosomal export protein NMD3 [Pyrodictiaceae archaeon]
MMRCAKCGRETDKLVDGRLCPMCYLEVYGLGKPPREIAITLCPQCGSYKFHGEWYESPDGGLEEIASMMFASLFKPTEHVASYRVEEVKLVKHPEGRLLARVRVIGSFKGLGESYEKEYLVPIKIIKQLCPNCFRRASGAPRAIVQIRSWSGRLSGDDRARVEEIIEELGDNITSYIIGFEEAKEGLNIKLTEQTAARMLAAKLKSLLAAKVTESFKVIGRESNGRPKTRLTLSVRLPLFYPGTVVDYEERLAVVKAIRGGKVVLRGIGSDKISVLDVDEAWSKLKQPDLHDWREAMVIALEPEWIHLQLLDKSFKYLELPLDRVVLEGRIVEGEEVDLIVYKGIEYILEKGLIKRSGNVFILEEH